MSDLISLSEAPAAGGAIDVALPADTPSVGQLFKFASEAEHRFASLRMHIRESLLTARGEEVFRHEVLVRHPGWARLNRHRGDDPIARDYVVWVSDGETVQTFAAADRRATVRRPMPGLVGATRSDLPAFARPRPPLTALPSNSLADTFVHPHGILHNVLATGPVALLGTTTLAGREVFVVRADHPRSALVLSDRPDRQVEVGIDRMTGLLVLLVERIGEDVTRHAETIALELDAPIPDEAFRLHLGPDVRLIF